MATSSSVVDVGEPLELTYQAPAGATVLASWIDRDLVAVFTDDPVPAKAGEPTKYPYTFLPTRAGMWTARFRTVGPPAVTEQYDIRARSVSGPGPLAALGEVAEQFGGMTAAQEGLAIALLRAASKLLRSNLPDVDARIRAGDLDDEVVGLAVVNMVLRVMRNPKGLRAETTGPFSRTYDTTAAAGLLVLTDAELAPLGESTDDSEAPSAVGMMRVSAGLAPPHQPRNADGWW